MRTFAGIDITTGRHRLISDLDKETHRGLRCNCKCPGCGQLLVSKMGDKVSHHFAHHSKNDLTNQCGESSLHLMGKIILSRMTKIDLPAFSKEEKMSCDSKYLGQIKERRSPLFGDACVAINSCEIEKRVGDIVSDVMAECTYRKSKILINFEIFVTHSVDAQKKQKIINEDITTVEIRLSHINTDNDIGDIISDIKESIANTRNHKVIHTSEDLWGVDEYSNFKKNVSGMDDLVEEWLNWANEKLANGGVDLPSTNISDLDSFNSGFPPSFSSKPSQGSSSTYAKNKYNRQFRIPNLPQYLPTDIHVDIASIEPKGNARLILNGLYKGKEISIPVIIKGDKIENQIIEDCSYLEIHYSHIPAKFGPIFTWGRNLMIERKRLDRAKLFFEAKRESERRLEEEAVMKLKAVQDQYKNISNFDEDSPINNRLLTDLSRINLDYSKVLILGSDSYEIMNCHEHTWQLAVIHIMLRCNPSILNDEFTLNELKWLEEALDSEYGINIKKEYKDILYLSKVISEIGAEIPFKTPFKLLSEFKSHLSKNI